MNIRIPGFIVLAFLILGCSKEGNESMPAEFNDALAILEGEWQVNRKFEMGCSNYDELSSAENLDYDRWLIDTEGNYVHYFFQYQRPVQDGGTISFIRKEEQYYVFVLTSKYTELDTNELYFTLDEERVALFDNICDYNDDLERVRKGEEWEKVYFTVLSTSAMN